MMSDDKNKVNSLIGFYIFISYFFLYSFLMNVVLLNLSPVFRLDWGKWNT